MFNKNILMKIGKYISEAIILLAQSYGYKCVTNIGIFKLTGMTKLANKLKTNVFAMFAH